jgi:hypothetical protein
MGMQSIYIEAREAGFLVGQGICMRQVTQQSAIFIAAETKTRFICYRIKWDAKQQIEEEKFYCRGSWKRCLNKAKGIIEFYETNVFKSKKAS